MMIYIYTVILGCRSWPGWALLGAGLCACSSAPVAKSELPFQPPVVTADSAADGVKDAPTLSQALAEDGACASQDDCANDEVCVAVELGEARCQQKSDGAKVSRHAPNGRPAPPLGLLDGQVMRDHAARSAR